MKKQKAIILAAIAADQLTKARALSVELAHARQGFRVWRPYAGHDWLFTDATQGGEPHTITTIAALPGMERLDIHVFNEKLAYVYGQEHARIKRKHNVPGYTWRA